MLYQIDILDKTQNFVAPIRNTAPLDSSGVWLKFNKVLSSWGTCRFRVSTKDPILTTEGDILQPWKNHVRIRRAGVVVWQGVIIRNPSRTKDFIDVEARSYLYMLDRVLIRHDAADGKGAENYRTIQSGTMASWINTFLTESKTDMGAAITTLTAGQIDNPTFPADFKDTAGTALTGAWTFSPTFLIKFDYRSFLYVLKTFGAYANFDFELTDAMVLNFQLYVGTKKPEMKFFYGEFGNIEDYNTPLDGQGMANFLQGAAADNEYNIIHTDFTNSDSINTYGKIAAVAYYSDVKNVNLLTSRLREEGALVGTPDAEIHISLNHKAYPVGTYNIGDTITIEVKDHVVNTSSLRRIVSIETDVMENSDEQIKLITNKPRDKQ